MLQGLKERLLSVAGAPQTGGNGHGPKNSSSSREGQIDRKHGHLQHPPSRRRTEDEIVRHFQGKSDNQGSPGLRRRFLLKLAMSLHSYGSSASRTEYLIEKAADRLDIDVDIAVFPSLILLSFPSANDGPTGKEIHLLTVDSELDVDKLGRADELANRVGKEGAPLLLAYWRLKAIASSPPEFGKWWRLFGFALSASMSALLFFNGSLWDGAFSFLLGLAVGLLDIISSKSSLFGTVMEFSSALVVSFLARVFSVHLKMFNLCYFSMALSSLVQLLPGMSLTLGVSEMVAKAHVTGTSRIMYALFSALQLGFGLAMGEDIVWWAPKPVSAACPPPDLPIWYNLIWFSGYTFASNVLLSARFNQWPGMALSSFVGYAVSTLTSLHLDSSASSVLSAFAVGITGTAYSHFTGDLPLVMVLSGILLLVPGGIGVQGVAALLKDDVLSGMSFVFDMVVVGLSITLGLLIAKIALPSALFGASRVPIISKNTLAAQMEKDRDAAAECDSDSNIDDEEDMAI